MGGVLEGKSKLIVADEFELVFYGAANIVQVAPAGVHVLLCGELVEKLYAYPRVRIGNYDVAEPSLGIRSSACRRVFHQERLDSSLQISVERIQREAEVSRVVLEMVEAECVITLEEIRAHILADVLDACATVAHVSGTEHPIDQEIRFRRDLDAVVRRQQLDEEVILLVEARPEIREIELDDGPRDRHGFCAFRSDVARWTLARQEIG